MEFFMRAEVVVFSGVLLVVVLFGLAEMTATALAGTGVSNLLDALLDTDALPDSTLTNWLFVRDVPLMVSMTAALGGFALTGLAVQGLALSTTGQVLPTLAANALAGGGAFAGMRLLGLAFLHLKVNHTTALQPSEFIGRTAVLLSPTASRGNPGEAKFTDQHGQTHYVMVQPRAAETVMTQGARVVLVEQVGAFYAVEAA